MEFILKGDLLINFLSIDFCLHFHPSRYIFLCVFSGFFLIADNKCSVFAKQFSLLCCFKTCQIKNNICSVRKINSWATEVLFSTLILSFLKPTLSFSCKRKTSNLINYWKYKKEAGKSLIAQAQTIYCGLGLSIIIFHDINHNCHLLKIYYVPGSISHLLYLIFTITNEISPMIIIPLLHMKSLRHREVKELTQVHIAAK